jgi:hypothetical protein
MSTAAYADLMFAWAAARLGDAGHAAEWRAPAVAALTATGDPVHEWLASAFAYRIDEALAGRAHGGDWPTAVHEGYAHSFSVEDDRVRRLGYRYVADQFRALYRVLEPDFLPNPYDPWMKWGTDACRHLHRLREIREDAGQDAISREFLDSLMMTTAGNQLTPRFIALRLAASWARHLNAATAERVLAEAAGLLGQYLVTPPFDSEARYELKWLADTSCFLAVVHRRADYLIGLVGRLDTWLRRRESDSFIVRRLFADTLIALYRLDLAGEAVALLDIETEAGGRLVAGLDAIERLKMAGVAWWLDRPGVVERIFQPARAELSIPPKNTMHDGPRAAAYLSAVGKGRIAEARPLLTTFLSVMPRVPNGFTTATHFSRPHLEIAEATALALSTDDFSGVPDLHTRLGPDEVAGRRALLPRLRDAIHAWGRDDWR